MTAPTHPPSGRPDLTATAGAAYAAAADHFDAPALTFWDRFGRRTLDRVGIEPGHQVLDVCCGTGASAVPAAVAVGPTGSVLGIDLSEPALGLARGKANALGLTNLDLVADDFQRVVLPHEHFDRVVCVFGIFFFDDMSAAVQRLWALVRPGGRLAVTIWGPDLFEPAISILWETVAAERPDLAHGWHPWTRVTDAAGLRDVLRLAGIPGDCVEIEAQADRHPLRAPEDWWTIVLGTGCRATIDQLAPDAADRVRQRTLAELSDRTIDTIVTDVVYAVADKPAGGTAQDRPKELRAH